VIVNDLKIEQAIWACQLHGQVPNSTLYSRVKAARDKGTYNNEIRKAEAKKIGVVIDILDDSSGSRNISPVTMTTTTTNSSSGDTTITSRSSKESKKPRSRRSSKQASMARLDAKRVKLEYDRRYKEAFKDATNLVAANNTGEPVTRICNRLNQDFQLDGKKRLARSTVYQAAKDGLAGMSPKARGPAPKIPDSFLEMVATHAEVSQVGEGELKGRDVKRLIGASIVGTEHETRFKVESVWRKVRREFPAALQAATKLVVDDARAQWTTFDNLNQWFDDVKNDLIKTGLVVNEQVLDGGGALVSEVRFLKDTERRIINMDETHHD